MKNLDFKSFMLGIALCFILMMLMGFQGVELGSQPYKPMYVKIVK